MRLSRADTHIRRVTSLLFACLYYVQTSMGYIHHVRGRMEGSSLSLSVLTERHAHTQAKTNQLSRGVTVDISVNTSNCLPAWEVVSVNPA